MAKIENERVTTECLKRFMKIVPMEGKGSKKGKVAKGFPTTAISLGKFIEKCTPMSVSENFAKITRGDIYRRVNNVSDLNFALRLIIDLCTGHLN